jgi:uncharacterized protein (TIGR02594 family)
MVQTSMLQVAKTFIGTREVAGAMENPMILAMLQSVDTNVHEDEVPWCSAFINFVAKLLSLPRSRSLSARSWLKVGVSVSLVEAVADSDVVILKRGGPGQPGPEALQAPGHVGLFVSLSADKKTVSILGGNQSDAVNIENFPVDRILGIRRL